jgi:hypothetical protein
VTVDGRDFTDTTTVTWNGNQVSTTLVSPTQLQVTLPAASLTNPIAGPITASNGPGAGLSNSLAFTVLPDMGPDLHLDALNLSGFDLVWNAAKNVLYVAAADTDKVNGNTIVTVNPITSTVKSETFAGSQPTVLAISDDDRYLYAGFSYNAIVQRYTLPSMTADVTVSLGVGGNPSQGPPGASDNCDFAVGLEVAPGVPQTIAVAQGNVFSGPSGCGPLAIFDNAVARPETVPGYVGIFVPGHDFSSISWAGSDSIYAQTSASMDPQDLYSLSVSPSGVSFDKDYWLIPGLGERLHFDPGTGYLYSDGGRVTNPADGSAIGYFPASGLMAPDSKLGRAFFLGQFSNQTAHTTYTLQVYDIRSFKLIKSIDIPNVIGFPTKVVRWGDSGLAFITYEGDRSGNNAPGLLYVLSGAAVTGPASSSSTTAVSEHVRLIWDPHQASRLMNNHLNVGRK